MRMVWCLVTGATLPASTPSVEVGCEITSSTCYCQTKQNAAKYSLATFFLCWGPWRDRLGSHNAARRALRVTALSFQHTINPRSCLLCRITRVVWSSLLTLIVDLGCINSKGMVKFVRSKTRLISCSFTEINEQWFCRKLQLLIRGARERKKCPNLEVRVPIRASAHARDFSARSSGAVFAGEWARSWYGCEGL
jgi:hypothetical protein